MTEQSARAEAERRYRERYSPALTAGAVRGARMEAFENGAEWARQDALPKGAKWFPDEGGIMWHREVYYPASYVLTRTDIQKLRAEERAAVLAEVRAGIEALPTVYVTTPLRSYHALMPSRVLAVLDSAAESETTETEQ